MAGGSEVDEVGDEVVQGLREDDYGLRLGEAVSEMVSEVSPAAHCDDGGRTESLRWPAAFNLDAAVDVLR